MNRLSLLLMLPLIVVLAAGCKGDGSVKTALGQQFTLAIGQTATFKNNSLKIKFIDVTQDSRCPKGVQCIQAGQVVCSVEITTNGATIPVVLTEIGGSSEFTSNASGGLTFNFQVLPYPEAGKQIDKKDYRLTMTVRYSP